MPRLIDADAFVEFMRGVVKHQKYEDLTIDGMLTVADVIEAVISDLDGTSFDGFKNAPTIDAVPVVRCKDCKWFGDFGCAIKIVDDSDRPTENDFCSFAERKDE